MSEFYKMKICTFWQGFVNYYFDPVRHERVALVVCTVYSVVLMLEFSFLCSKIHSQIVICNRVNTSLQLIDPVTLQSKLSFMINFYWASRIWLC